MSDDLAELEGRLLTLAGMIIEDACVLAILGTNEDDVDLLTILQVAAEDMLSVLATTVVIRHRLEIVASR